MEFGVRLIGIILRILNLVLKPILWLLRRHKRRVSSPPPPLLLRSAVELAAAIRNGEVKSEDLVLTVIDRVKEVNPLLNAVVDERYRAALDEAKEVDRQIAEAKKDGTLEDLVKDKPLLGVPFTVKESCSLAGLSNSVGCLEFAGRRATADGGAVQLVRNAGAIPVLVSNTPELCLGWETTNLLRGTTNNPYCLERTPGGSSGGEAALLACGASVFSVASDVAGSIRLPAAFCGVFGHKPTPGVISIQGHIPYLNSELFPELFAVGPMTRKAEDLPLLLDVMAGDHSHKFRLKDPVDLRKLKIYYMTEAGKSLALINVEPCIQDMVIKAVKYLEKECGSKVCEEKFEDLEDAVEISVSVFFSMKDIPNMLLDPTDPKRQKSLILEIIKSAFGGATRSMQALGFALLDISNLFIPRSRRGYYSKKALQLRTLLMDTLGDNGVLIFPVNNGLAHYHNQVFVKTSGVIYTMVFNILGMPATTVPMGLHDGLPIAIQVVGAPGQDRLCLAVARELEKGFGGWRPPL